MDIICFCLNCGVSGKFPETVWWTMHSRKATHLGLVILSSWGRNHLVAHP